MYKLSKCCNSRLILLVIFPDINIVDEIQSNLLFNTTKCFIYNNYNIIQNVLLSIDRLFISKRKKNLYVIYFKLQLF